MPPSNLDTSAIREALLRRRVGGIGGGNPIPAQQQLLRPNALGGPIGPSSTPLQTPPTPQAVGALPQPAPGVGAPPTPQAAPQQPQVAPAGAGVDDETKTISKALIAKLLKLM